MSLHIVQVTHSYTNATQYKTFNKNYYKFIDKHDSIWLKFHYCYLIIYVVFMLSLVTGLLNQLEHLKMVQFLYIYSVLVAAPLSCPPKGVELVKSLESSVFWELICLLLFTEF